MTSCETVIVLTSENSLEEALTNLDAIIAVAREQGFTLDSAVVDEVSDENDK